MKTVLVIGGYGFLGTNILKYIEDELRDQFNVIVLDRFPENRSGLVLHSVIKSYAGDFSDSTFVESVFAENRIDLVIHSLSTTIPALSHNARYDVETNLIPTLGLLSCMIRHNVSRIVYLSSGGAVYGDSIGVPHKESDDVFPISTYGVVKLAIEKYLMLYAKQFGLQPLIIRLSNPFGPYHYSMQQGICNVAIDTALSGKPFTVWGDGASLKDYIYVTDFVRILFMLIKKGIHGEVINIGSGNLSSVNDILHLVKKHIPGFTWAYGNSSSSDVAQFELDTSRLREIIGEYQFVGMEEGIRRVFDWKEGEKRGWFLDVKRSLSYEEDR